MVRPTPGFSPSYPLFPSPTLFRSDGARNQVCTPQEVEWYVRAGGREPVLMLTDSPWVQVVARKPDAGSDDALRATLAAAAAQIQYPPLWTELFNCILEDRKSTRLNYSH